MPLRIVAPKSLKLEKVVTLSLKDSWLIHCIIVYLRSMVVSLATMIFVILNTYWIRSAVYFFAAISHCSLQGILKNLHKVPQLAFLKWLLKFHYIVSEVRTEIVSFFDR